MITTEQQTEMNFFFWLGRDGEINPVSEAEFLDKQDEYREELNNWLNVTTETLN